MNSYDRIYEMLVYPDPIEEDFKSAAKAILHPVRAIRRATTSRLPKTGLRKKIAGARRTLGREGREIATMAPLIALGIANLGGQEPASTHKDPVPVEQPASDPGVNRARKLVKSVEASRQHPSSTRRGLFGPRTRDYVKSSQPTSKNPSEALKQQSDKRIEALQDRHRNLLIKQGVIKTYKRQGTT